MHKLIWQNNLGKFSFFNSTNLIGNAFFIKGFQERIQILSVFANGLETEAERFLCGVDFNHDVAERQRECALNKGGQRYLLLYICPMQVAASHKHGTSRCLSCTM